MSAHAAPLAATSIGFDLDEVLRGLGEGDDTDEASEQTRADTLDTLHAVLTWILDVNVAAGADVIVGRRFLAVILALEPQAFSQLPNLRRIADGLNLAPKQLPPTVKARLSTVARGLFAMVWTGNRDEARSVRIVGRRFMSVAWVINPGFFHGSPSLASIARRLGVTPKALQKSSARASRATGIVNRGQSHGWNRGRTA